MSITPSSKLILLSHSIGNPAKNVRSIRNSDGPPKKLRSEQSKNNRSLQAQDTSRCLSSI
ncbi:hypothetical protein OKW34_003281 [Paraburkholderia youngii]